MATACRCVGIGADVRRRRVFVPPEATGLLDALADAQNGDEEALRRWDRAARPILMRALRRRGFDAASADDAIMHLLEQADRAARSPRTILRELRWMSAVLASSRREQRRAGLRATAASRRLAERIVPWYEAPHGDEDREELLVAASRLQPRFAMAIRLRLRGLDAHEARVALCVELALGPKQARRIDTRALALLREELCARDT